MDNDKLGQDQYTLTQLHAFVREAQEISSIWRPDSWTAEEFMDGQQYTQSDYDKLFNAGIDPLTINRVFPTINLMLGLQIVNKYDTGAKGRTQKDSEVGQLMSEGIKYIDDQSGTEFLTTRATKDQLVPGIGWLMCCHNPDPREEEIAVRYRDWKEMWWDPFSDPWVEPRTCRYVFHQPYKDIEHLIATFPDKKEELEAYSYQTSNERRSSVTSMWYDEAQQVEDMKIAYGGRDSTRRRVRPVEMWYPVYETGYWAIYADRTAKPIPTKLPPVEFYARMKGATEVVQRTVMRMWTTTFLDNIVLQDGLTPFNHDLYPFVPLVGYVNRYKFPYGVPHQMRGQQVEINKRRSMALALLQKRRVIAEAGVVPKGPNAARDLIHLYEEANKLDGFMIVQDGHGAGLQIIEGTEKGALQAQVMMLQEAERELKEITGANDEQAGYKGQAISGIAQQKRQDQANTIIAPLTENRRRSRKLLGQLQVAEIQGRWTGERVLRVTDRISGAEKFVSLNEKVLDERTGAYVIRNNVTQGKFDVIVTDAPPTDAVREQNMNLLIEWAKKSPPEMISRIMVMAMELSNLPNKDALLDKLKEIVGIDPTEEDMSADQRKARLLQALEQHKQQAQAEAQFQQQLKGLALEKAQLENDLLNAQIQAVQTKGDVDIMKVKAADDKVKIDGFRVGAEVADREKRRQAEERERYARAIAQPEKGAVA